MEEQVYAVQRMQDYIDTHLDQRITPAALARASRYSPWHAYRLFVRHVGLTPADYIRRLRLSRSALRLRDEPVRILDVALDAGYASVDGYQRAFFQAFGCNPGAYAARPVPLPLFTPYGVQYRLPKKEDAMQPVKTIFVQSVARPARKLIVKRGQAAEDYFAYCEEVGCDVWGVLTSIPALCGGPAGFWLPEAQRPQGTSRYVQGVEVDPAYDGPLPEGFDSFLLPAASYLMFCGEPFEEADYCQAIEQLWHAVEHYDPATLGYAWDNSQPRIQLEPVGARGYRELWPVKPL